MDPDDPFTAIVVRSIYSSSQEDFLRHCCACGQGHQSSAAADTDDSPETATTAAEPTGIIMYSLTDSDSKEVDEDTPRDVFQTPPEESLIVSSDDGGDGGVERRNLAVDVGVTVDLGLNTELTVPDTLDDELKKSRGLKRKFDSDNIINLTISGKGSEINDEFHMEIDKHVVDEVRTTTNASIDKGKSVIDQSYRNIDEIEKFRYVGSSDSDSPETRNPIRGRRELPLSLRGLVETVVGGSMMDSRSLQEKLVGGVLEVLKEISNVRIVNSDEKFDLLEFAKSCGMTFPRPVYWPPGYNE